MAQPPALIIPKVAPKGRDIGFALGIVAILSILFLPIPPFLIDMGFAVVKAKITSAGKKICDAQLKLRTIPFDQVPLGPIVKKRAGEVGLFDALSARPQE